MKILLFILIVCCSLNGYGQYWHKHPDSYKRIKSIILKDFRKDLIGKGEIDSLMQKQGEWTFNNPKHNLIYSKGIYLNNEKIGDWKGFYVTTSIRLRTKSVYRSDSLFHLQYYEQNGTKRFELFSENGISKPSTKSIETLCHYYQKITIMLMRWGFLDNEVLQTVIWLFSSVLQENMEDAQLKFWNENKLLYDIRTYHNGIMKQKIINYYLKKPNKYTYFTNGLKTEIKQIIDFNPNHFQVTKFFPNGNKISKSTFKNGQLVGNYKEWDDSGKLIVKKKYR